MIDVGVLVVALVLGLAVLSRRSHLARRLAGRLAAMRFVTRGLVATVTIVLLAVSTTTTSYADTVTPVDQTFELTWSNSVIMDGPVPAGTQKMRVILGPGEGPANTFYGVAGSCQLIGGGTRDFGANAHAWSYTGYAWFSEVDAQGCASVYLYHRIHFGAGADKAVKSVAVSFTGVPAPAVASELFSADIFARFGSDWAMGWLGDPVQSLTGNFGYSRADVIIPGRGPTPGFVRTYNSADTRDGLLGLGWTHNYTIRIRKPDGDTTGALLLIGPQGRQDRYTYSSGDGRYTPPEGTTTRLTRNVDLTFTATHKDNSAWIFNADGQLTGIRDRHGNLSTLTYDTSGRLSTIGDPAGRGSLTLTYDANGRLWKVTDWLGSGRVVEYSYDTNTPSRLRTVTDREGNITTYGYDGTTQRLTTITDDNGHVALTHTYDGNGRVATQKDAKGLSTGQQTTFSYVTNGDGTKTTTVTSHEPSWTPTVADTYDTSGRIIKRVAKPSSSSADDVVIEYTYDTNGNLATAKDARGFTTTFCYDVGENGAAVIGSSRNLTRRIDPAPASGGNVLVTLDSYDVHDNLTRTIPPKGVSSGTSTTCTTDLSSSLDLDYATTLTYDAAGVKLLSTTRSYTDPDSGAQTAKTTFEYDTSQPGLVSYVTPPRGNTGSSPDHTYATSFSYFGTSDPSSKRGLLKSVVDPLGNTTTFDYDAVGRRTSMVDPLGNASGGTPADHRWEYEYDNENRLRYARAPAPGFGQGSSQLVTESRYDGVGNLLTLVDANGQVTKYLYDERDSLQEVWESPSTWTDPASTPSPKITTAYQYDHTGNLSRVTRAKDDSTYERAIDYTYDGLNRVRTETQYPDWPNLTPALVMQTTYDANSNRATVVDQLSRTTTFTYDRLNRLTGIDYSDSCPPDVSYAYKFAPRHEGPTAVG